MKNLEGIWSKVSTDVCISELMQAEVPCVNVKPVAPVRSKIAGVLRFGGGQHVRFEREADHWLVTLAKPMIKTDTIVYRIQTQSELNNLVATLKTSYGEYRRKSVFTADALAKLMNYRYSRYRPWAREGVADIAEFEYQTLVQYVECLRAQKKYDKIALVLASGLDESLIERLPVKHAQDLQQSISGWYYWILSRNNASQLVQLRCKIENPLHTGRKQFDDCEMVLKHFRELCHMYLVLLERERLGCTYIDLDRQSLCKRLRVWAAHVISIRQDWLKTVQDKLSSTEFDSLSISESDLVYCSFATTHLAIAAALEIVRRRFEWGEKRWKGEHKEENLKNAARLYLAKATPVTGDLRSVIEDEIRLASYHAQVISKENTEAHQQIRQEIDDFASILYMKDPHFWGLD